MNRRPEGALPTATILSDGTFALDGGALFGIVPRPLWRDRLSPDAENRVRLGLNCLLVEAGSRKLLVDTGVGDKWDARFGDRHVVRRNGGLPARLAEKGIAPEDITDVVNTHLHWDHAGGNTRMAGDQPVAAFPRARYHVQRGELDMAREEHPRVRGSYRREDFECLLQNGQMALLDGPGEIFPGVRVEPAAGHLPFMQVVTVATAGGETLFFPSDLVPTSHHLAPAWGMSYDLDPMVLARTKGEWLERCAAGGWGVVFYHDPDCHRGQVVREEGRWVVRRHGEEQRGSDTGT